MADFKVTHEFANYLGQGDVELDAAGHSFRAALTNVAPTQAGTTTLASVTQIAATGGYTTVALTGVTYTETGAGTGIWQFTSNAFSWTATAANFDLARYIVIYDDTHPSDAVVGYLDYGSAFQVTEGNTLTITPGANGIFRITVS